MASLIGLLLIAGVIALWQWDFMLGGVLAFAMFMNLVVAGVAGASIPIILKKMNIDPAIASSVFVTTITDVIGFVSFLGVSAYFL